MPAKEAKSSARPRVLGNVDHLGSDVAVKKWEAPDAAELVETPDVPENGGRGWELEAPGQPQEKLPEGVAEDSTHAFIFRHPQETAAVLRTILRSAEVGSSDGPLAGMSARQLVAAFLRTTGQRIGSRVVGHLDPEEQMMAVQGIALEGEATRQAGMHVLEQVRQRIISGDYVDRGGREFATGLLQRAFGAGRARTIVSRALDGDEVDLDPIHRLGAEVLASFISHEHPQSIAMILLQLDPPKAAGVISRLPEQLQGDVAYRMATSAEVAPEIVARVWESFTATLQCADNAVGGSQSEDESATAGRRLHHVAQMLNWSGASPERTVLNHLDATDPQLAEAVRSLMFTFADLIKLPEHELGILAREIDQHDLVISLKAAGENLREKLLRTLSEQARNDVREQLDSIGPMRLGEVEEAQLRIVQKTRQLEEQGKVTLVRGDAGEPFV